jgi:ribosomal protein S18 acetylase RimI-like enzyme
MTTYYEKIPFVWEEPQPLIRVPKRLEFRSFDNVGKAAFTDAVRRAIIGSLDLSDQKAVIKLGAARAADKYVAAIADDFDYRSEWWQLGFDEAGKLAGFIQPVIYRGCAKNGLEEGTIYYIGVVPEQRGKRYINDLLCKATRILQEVGVWRIFCDTYVLNTPMIKAFKEVGYRQFGPAKRRPL